MSLISTLAFLFLVGFYVCGAINEEVKTPTLLTTAPSHVELSQKPSTLNWNQMTRGQPSTTMQTDVVYESTKIPSETTNHPPSTNGAQSDQTFHDMINTMTSTSASTHSQKLESTLAGGHITAAPHSDSHSTAAHDDSKSLLATSAMDPTSIGPWRLVTAEAHRAAVAGKRFGRLHRHKTTPSPSTDLETQLTLEGGDEDGETAGQSASSGQPEQKSQQHSTTTSPVMKQTQRPVIDTEDPGDKPAAKSTETEIEISEPTEPAKPHFKLIYFDARGICESIRLLFRYANQSFVDERISKKKWIAIKDSTFFGKIPILEVDGKPLAQCYGKYKIQGVQKLFYIFAAISRFLARQFGLAGADDWESAKLDEAADFHKGVHNEISPYIFVLSGYRQGEKDSLRKELFIPTVEKNFPIYVNLLKQSPTGFFGKSNVSWVDFVISEYMTTIRFYEPLIMEKYPVITRFIDKVQALPQIKDYIRQRAKTPLQLFQY